MSPPVTFISSPHPESFVEHRVLVRLRDKVAGSALKNGLQPWLLGQCGQLGQGRGKRPPPGPCYGIQTILQSSGHGQRLTISGSEQGNAQSSCRQCLLVVGS